MNDQLALIPRPDALGFGRAWRGSAAKLWQARFEFDLTRPNPLPPPTRVGAALWDSGH